MNLLLVEAREVTGGVVRLADRRARHLREVVGVQAGATIRVGVLDVGVGTGEVLEVGPEVVAVRVGELRPARPPLGVSLVLAVPRPKALPRAIETCASFGVTRVDLTRAWRVEKSYLDAGKAGPARLREAAWLGAEQGEHATLPAIELHQRFTELLDARFAAPDPTELRVVAHARASGGRPVAQLEQVVRPGEHRRIVAAIGPEGGWIDRELDSFAARGFAVVSLGDSVLRVEAALAALLAQLELLRRLPAPPGAPHDQ